jgi:hypothetical protein
MGLPKYELEVCEHIDGSFSTMDSNAMYQAELRIIPEPGASCIRFQAPPTRDKAEAERARAYLSKLLT